jgi:chemotaxis family two-component system response regulator Rcp1
MTDEVVQSPGPHGRPIEIMLLEDNIGDVILIQKAFGKSKFATTVTVAEDGELALRMLRREGPFKNQSRPDLILLDLNLPKLDGREILQEVKRDATLSEIPVVVLSGSRAETEIARVYALHANAYIVKPVNFQHLQEIVSNIQSFWFGTVSLPPNATWVS